MSDTHECDARAIRETEKALLVELEDGEEVWIPKSVIDDDSEVFGVGDEGKLVVEGWFAVKQGWT
jgi:hypothetical protein